MLSLQLILMFENFKLYAFLFCLIAKVSADFYLIETGPFPYVNLFCIGGLYCVHQYSNLTWLSKYINGTYYSNINSSYAPGNYTMKGYGSSAALIYNENFPTTSFQVFYFPASLAYRKNTVNEITLASFGLNENQIYVIETNGASYYLNGYAFSASSFTSAGSYNFNGTEQPTSLSCHGASVCYVGLNNGSIMIFSTVSNSIIFQFSFIAHNNSISAIILKNTDLYSGDSSGKISYWDVTSNPTIVLNYTYHTSAILQFQLDLNGSQLFSYDFNGILSHWRKSDNKHLGNINIGASRFIRWKVVGQIYNNTVNEVFYKLKYFQCLVSNCLTCVNQTVCHVCNNGYFLNLSNICQSCNLSNCQTCATLTTCSVCTMGYLLNTSSLCQSCNLSNCQTCDTLTTCSVCTTGYLLNSLTLCQACSLTNCQTCATLTACSVCTTGYLLNTSSLCQSCNLSNCQTCDTLITCSVCTTGYLLNNSSLCQACSLTNCQTCDTLTTCSVCATGFFLNSSQLCQLCILNNCSACASQTICSSCAPGYTLNSSSLCQLFSSYNKQYEWTQTQLLLIEIVRKIVQVPVIRKSFTTMSIFFFNMQELWLYQYHQRQYGTKVSYVFQSIRLIESEKYLIFGDFISQLKQKFTALNPMKVNYSPKKFVVLQDNDAGFLTNTIDFFIQTVPLTLITMFILRRIFFCLFNFEISSSLRSYSLTGYFILVLMCGNCHYFYFLYCNSLQMMFFAQFKSKLVAILQILLLFFLIIFTFGYIYIMKYIYNKLSKYLVDNSFRMINSFHFFVFEYFLRSMLIGCAHSLLIYHYTYQISVLTVIDALSILNILLFMKRYGIFRNNGLAFFKIIHYCITFILNILLLYQHLQQPDQQKFNLLDECQFVMIVAMFVNSLIFFFMSTIETIVEFICKNFFIFEDKRNQGRQSLITLLKKRQKQRIKSNELRMGMLKNQAHIDQIRSTYDSTQKKECIQSQQSSIQSIKKPGKQRIKPSGFKVRMIGNQTHIDPIKLKFDPKAAKKKKGNFDFLYQGIEKIIIQSTQPQVEKKNNNKQLLQIHRNTNEQQMQLSEYQMQMQNSNNMTPKNKIPQTIIKNRKKVIMPVE